MNERLLVPFSREEVERVVKQMFPTKAPGSDGFPAIFYRTYWDIVGDQTVATVLRCLIMGSPSEAGTKK